MNITGNFNIRTVYNSGIAAESRKMVLWTSAIFTSTLLAGDQYPATAAPLPSGTDSSMALQNIAFDASKKWTGET